MYIANCPFNKMKILNEATIGLEKSFPMMYSNIGLNSRETVPLSAYRDINLHTVQRLLELGSMLILFLLNIAAFPTQTKNKIQSFLAHLQKIFLFYPANHLAFMEKTSGPIRGK